MLLLTVLISFFVSLTSPSFAEWIWRPDIGWINTKEIVKASPEDQLDYAKRLVEQGDYQKAAKAYRMLVYNYPDSKLAGPASVEAARCLMHTGYYYSAFVALKKAIQSYSSTIDLKDAVKTMYEIGVKFQQGAKREFFGIKIMSGSDAAVEVFEEAYNSEPWGEYADDSLFGIGESLKGRRKYAEAIERYQKLIDTFPDSPFVPRAKLAQATCYDLKSRGWERDYLSMSRAAETLREIKPDADVAEQAEAYREIIEDRLAHKHFDTAKFYSRRKKYVSSAVYLNKVIREFPNTVWAELAKVELERITPMVEKETGKQPDGNKATPNPEPAKKEETSKAQ